MSLLLVERPNGSKTGQPMSSNSLILSFVFVAVLTGDRRLLMGKAQSPLSPSLTLTRIISLRLITHLYSEHLLDQDHYLDWLIVSFRDSDLDALPVWLLIVQIHQQDVFQHRQRGRRLAEALLKHLDKVSRRCGSHLRSSRTQRTSRHLHQLITKYMTQSSSNSSRFSRISCSRPLHASSFHLAGGSTKTQSKAA